MLHIYNRHHKKFGLFRDYSDVVRFRKILMKSVQKYEVELFAYSIMDNHFHLLVEEGKDCGKFMASFQRSYAQYFNYRYGEKGKVFERTCKIKRIDSLHYLRNLKKYILINPIDRILEVKVKDLISVNNVGSNFGGLLT